MRNHHDAGCAVGEGDGAGREGAKCVNNPYRAIRAGSAFEQAPESRFSSEALIGLWSLNLLRSARYARLSATRRR